MLHLSNKQNSIPFFFVFIISWGFFGSDIPCGHFLPRQCPVPVPQSTSKWLSLQPPALRLLSEDPHDAELSLAFAAVLLSPSAVAVTSQPPGQQGPAIAPVCKQLLAGAGL